LVRVLHKDEKILGRKHIYLPHAQTAIYDSKVKLFLKQGICHQLGRDAVVRFECIHAHWMPQTRLKASGGKQRCQGFQSEPEPGTFTRMRSCIVSAEITEPSKISGGQNHKYEWKMSDSQNKVYKLKEGQNF
jgi:hypothetical protein